MAKFEFRLPDIGEGITEGEIVGWLVRAGDEIGENQDMVEVMTDKATVTIGSPKAGRVSELRGSVGEQVPVGQVLVVLDLEGKGDVVGSESDAAAFPARGPARSRDDDGPVASAVGDIRNSLPGIELAGAPRAVGSETTGGRALAAPATRKLARELGVDLNRIAPTGKAGRVTREDVEAAHHQAQPVVVPAPAPAVLAARPILVTPLGSGQTKRVPIRGIRRRIFEHMARSKHTAAHFTYVDECDVGRLRALRDRLSDVAASAGVHLTFLPFFVKAVVRALKLHPTLNATMDDGQGELVLRSNYDIGIAVSTDGGLIVPVLRDADRRSVLEIAREIARLGQAAKSGKIVPEDLGGSSFTITSLGKLGGLLATPVINYPEVAIIGLHEMKKRPVVRDDQIVIGEVMLVSLSFDHRVIDGSVGAAFAKSVIEVLEDPDRLLLES
jgi:pyruvate dehydrogenase E2 component (dihydrolipoamide acetyltransferase)